MKRRNLSKRTTLSQISRQPKLALLIRRDFPAIDLEIDKQRLFSDRFRISDCSVRLDRIDENRHRKFQLPKHSFERFALLLLLFLRLIVPGNFDHQIVGRKSPDLDRFSKKKIRKREIDRYLRSLDNRIRIGKIELANFNFSGPRMKISELQLPTLSRSRPDNDRTLNCRQREQHDSENDQ